LRGKTHDSRDEIGSTKDFRGEDKRRIKIREKEKCGKMIIRQVQISVILA